MSDMVAPCISSQRMCRAPRRSGAYSIDALEFLDATAEAHFRRVEVAFGVDRDVVHPLELPRLASVTPPLAELLTGVAHERRDLPVRAVRGEDEALLLVHGQHEVPHRAVRKCRRLDLELLHER